MLISDAGDELDMRSEFECPECGEAHTFELVAHTTIQLGTKQKWQCSECDHTRVRIGDDIDTTAQAERYA